MPEIDLAQAADALRAAGYAVVTASEHEHIFRWLKEAHKRESEAVDRTWQLEQQVSYLTDMCGRLLNGSRPQWYREARRFRENSWQNVPRVAGERP
jgi:hypothetical protein